MEAFLKVIEFSNNVNYGLHWFEVGSNEKVTIRNFVNLVKEIAGNNTTQLNFGALPYRKNEVMESHVDTSPLFELGWQPKVSLFEGLTKTIELERKNLFNEVSDYGRMWVSRYESG